MLTFIYFIFTFILKQRLNLYTSSLALEIGQEEEDVSQGILGLERVLEFLGSGG